MKWQIAMKLFSAHFFIMISATGLANPCTGKSTSILVLTQQRHLFLCEDGLKIQSFRIAIGKGGIGKEFEGDNKTPLGTYRVGKPRASEKFGIFIPIGYPTESQRQEGLTGSNVGIHGPHWFFQHLGPLTTLINWTQGCVAVESRRAIGEIAKWLAEKPFVKIELHE